MKLVLCDEIEIAPCDDGCYACLYEKDCTWNIVIITIRDGRQVDIASSGGRARSRRTELRKCINIVDPEQTDTLIIVLSENISLPEMEATIQNCFGDHFQPTDIDIVGKQPFPDELS